MCSLRWRGKDAIAFLESVTVADIENMPMGKVSPLDHKPPHTSHSAKTPTWAGRVGFQMSICTGSSTGRVLIQSTVGHERGALGSPGCLIAPGSVPGNLGWLAPVRCLDGHVTADALSQGSLSLITNEQGGIIDDTMITKTSDAKGDHIYQVSSRAFPALTVQRSQRSECTAATGAGPRVQEQHVLARGRTAIRRSSTSDKMAALERHAALEPRRVAF